MVLSLSVRMCVACTSLVHDVQDHNVSHIQSFNTHVPHRSCSGNID